MSSERCPVCGHPMDGPRPPCVGCGRWEAAHPAAPTGWRLVMADGTVVPVDVAPSDGGAAARCVVDGHHYRRAAGTYCYAGTGPEVERDAVSYLVAALASECRCPREVVPPGEPTRAGALAELRGRGVVRGAELGAVGAAGAAECDRLRAELERVAYDRDVLRDALVWAQRAVRSDAYERVTPAVLDRYLAAAGWQPRANVRGHAMWAPPPGARGEWIDRELPRLTRATVRKLARVEGRPRTEVMAALLACGEVDRG